MITSKQDLKKQTKTNLGPVTSQQEPLGRELSEFEVVDEQDVVEDDTAEVKRVEHGSDAAGHRFRHRRLESKSNCTINVK